MITSMTGFGRYEAVTGSKKLTVEMKSVNHRYLDITIHMPRRFNMFDGEIRKLLANYIHRGKVDVSITYKDEDAAAVGIKYNKDVAALYMDYFKKMSKDFDIKNNIKVSDLASFPEIITNEEKEENEDEMFTLIKEGVTGAAEKLRDTRSKEGEALKADLMDKLDKMLENVDLIEQRYPQIIAEYKEKLLAKLSEVKADTSIDDSRLAAEMVIYSDRLCTDEETVRLRNHIVSMKQTLTKGGEIGRKLDFMTQEMNREANTILSKSNDFRTSEIGIALKTDIEKVREQIQNIE